MILKERSQQSGFTLIEVLVASVIFTGAFLMLFALLGRVLANSSAALQIKLASIVDTEMSRYLDGKDNSHTDRVVEIDGMHFRLDRVLKTEAHRTILRLTVLREHGDDTLGVFYGVHYVGFK